MADTEVTTTTDTAPELRIEIWRDEAASYIGTAAQLQAEGLIPVGFVWPQAAADKRWQAGGFDYWLRRTRPEGHKGPMKSWLELDSWWVRVKVTGRDYNWQTQRRLERQAEELRRAIYRETPAGSREWNTNWRRFDAANCDTNFQAFKAKVPGLIPPKRGRKPKAQPGDSAQASC